MDKRSLVTCVLCLLLAVTDSKDFTFTFSISAGARQCFHELMDEGTFFELEYQVYIN